MMFIINQIKDNLKIIIEITETTEITETIGTIEITEIIEIEDKITNRKTMMIIVMKIAGIEESPEERTEIKKVAMPRKNSNNNKTNQNSLINLRSIRKRCKQQKMI